jgi:MoaA/NifB/PqqE/SkfB family radical SAM enzyme
LYIYTGGEPLVRKDDLIRLCEKHPDCEFLCFTNGTLIDEEFADEMLRVKNFIPAISLEGFEEATDAAAARVPIRRSWQGHGSCCTGQAAAVRHLLLLHQPEL